NIELMGSTVEAYHFQQQALGHRMHVWVNALGEVLIEEMPMGFRAVREPEAEARFGLRDAEDTEDTEPDAQRIDLSGVDSDALDRWRWSEATVVLDEMRISAGIADNRQSAEVKGEQVTLTIRSMDALPTFGALSETQQTELSEYLGESFEVELDAASVRAAHRAVGLAPDA